MRFRATFRINLISDCRSPSPEPVYDHTGKRLNTRDVRKRQEFELRRHQAILELQKMNPLYRPPADYR